jgi:hypothetical protein
MGQAFRLPSRSLTTSYALQTDLASRNGLGYLNES